MLLSLLCLTFAIICEVQSKTTERVKTEAIPIVRVVNMTINPESNLLKNKGNGLLQWLDEVKEGEKDIQIYAVLSGQEHEFEELCKNKPQTLFPKIVKLFLGIESCPIEKVPIVQLSNLRKYEVNTETDLVEDKDNRILEWQDEVKVGDNDIMIYANVSGEVREIEELCVKDTKTLFPDIVTRFLGIGSCPVKKGSLSYVSRIISRSGDRKKGYCENGKEINLILKTVKDKKNVMSMDIFIEDIRLDDCTAE